jgi:alpha-L-rhamnosidase
MSADRSDRPWDLRVEHLDEAFGIDTTIPGLSWKLPRLASRQLAFRVRAGGWDSGRVETDVNILVPYAGPQLRSRQRVDWDVKVWTDVGESAWSSPARWEMGLLGADDWIARWIEPSDSDWGTPGKRHAHVFRTTFSAGGSRARLYATAHGVYEVFLNGVRVGELELTPGFTSYRHRLQVQTYDVTDLLRPGRNDLRAVVSDGWYRGQVGALRQHDIYGSTLGLLAQLEVEGRPIAATDATWEHATSTMIADLMEGQETDLRSTDEALDWSGVRVADHPLEVLCSSDSPPVRRVEIVRPRSVTQLGDGKHIVDLGQNINGWLRLANLGPRDTTLTITHGEALDDAGDVTMEHLRTIHWKTQEPLSAGQVDVIVSDGDAPEFEPRHTTHGFQFARIEGHRGPVGVDDVAGVVVHTDFRRTGWFECSDARLNRLHAAADWSFRTNATDIPTDCPQRERAGWTGDWQIFAPTAAFLYDVAGFSTKWLRDLAADQRADGAVRNFAPDPAPAGADDHAVKTFLEGSAGWGDAAVLVPWAMWRNYGDKHLLERQWPSMVAWVEYQTRVANDARHKSRIDRSTTPAAHEKYLWDTGFHWGEWCEPDGNEDHFANLERDFGIIATAYFAHSSATLAKIARVLDRAADAERYDDLSANIARSWCTEFLDDDGNVRSSRQADHVRALAFNLVPTELRQQTSARLVQLIRDCDTHLNTGFLATPLLLPVLADAGHLDVAYDVLMQSTPPSWLAMIDRHATTIWEEWNGIDERGNPHASLNHYSKGAVISFLHEYVAGIRLLDDGPAYRRFRIAPMPGGGITSAKAVHDSPYGRIESAWSIVGDELRLLAQVPPNTSAVVDLPDGNSRTILPGTSTFVEKYDGR